MSFQFVLDAWKANDWDKMSDAFSNANLYQSWHYGEFNSRGLWRDVSRAALLIDQKCLVMSQFRVKRLPFGPGVAEAEWGPLFDTGKFSEQRHWLREFLIRAREEYCGRRRLDLRIIPRSLNSPEQDSRICDIFHECGFIHNETARAYKTIVLDLGQNLSAIRKALDQKWRNQLNVAEKAGLTLEIGNTSQMFDRFYKIYLEMWAKKRFPTGVRVPSVRKMYHVLPEGRRMHITIAKDGDQDIGGSVCAFCGDTLLYYLGATSPQLRQGGRPGYLLQWSHITAAKEKGLRWYDTGGISDDAPDISRFKTRMNGLIVQFPGRFEFPSGRNGERFYGAAERVYRKARRVLTGR